MPRPLRETRVAIGEFEEAIPASGGQGYWTEGRLAEMSVDCGWFPDGAGEGERRGGSVRDE